MAVGLLGTATTGLAAFQRAISVTGNNIANANTDGYSRQRVEFGDRPSSFTGSGYVGNGVQVQSIERVFDQFITERVRDTTSAASQADAFAVLSGQVTNLLGDADAGLNASFESFFNAVQTVADDPSSTVTRQLLLSESESLTTRFKSLDSQLDSLDARVNGVLANSVTEINGLTAAIADANKAISDSTSQGSGAVANDLLDKRDRLINQLSEIISVRTVEQDDGAVNVFVGSGQPLVTRYLATPLQIENSPFDAQRKEISIAAGGSSAVITSSLTGGRLGAVLEFRDQVLNPTKNALGRMAVSVGLEFNAQHKLGTDLDGNVGTDYFSVTSPAILGSSNNTGAATISATFDTANIQDLTADDYVLAFDGAVWNLTRFNSGQTVASGAGPFNVDGLQIAVGGGAAVAGDRFEIRPTRNASSGLDVLVTDTREIAAAAALVPPATSAPGDNRNALLLAGLQTGLSMEGGNTNYQGAYSQLIGELGTQTRRAQITSEAQTALLAQAKESRESVSGVNLDEEAANLLKYQQAYQAVARIIAVADDLFQTLLATVGR